MLKEPGSASLRQILGSMHLRFAEMQVERLMERQIEFPFLKRSKLVIPVESILC